MPFYSTSIVDFEQANVCWNIWKPFILQMSKTKLRKYNENYEVVLRICILSKIQVEGGKYYDSNPPSY